MRALPGLRALPLLLLGLLAAGRAGRADGETSVSPFTSLPIREETTTKHFNSSLETPNISLTVSPFTSLPIREETTTKHFNSSLETPNISLTVSPFTSLPIREETTTKHFNPSLETLNISLTDIGKQAAEASVKYCKKQGVRSSVPVEKNITLERPSNIELTCQFITSGNVNSVNVTWKKGDKQLENIHTNAIGNILYTQYMFIITDSKQMGSYSCFLEEEKEQRGTFNFKVPEVQGKNKPLITYVGDSVVLICKCQHCSSLNWTWYTNNGSAQVPIDVQMNDKYEIKGTNANETKLKIMHLSEDNKGSYWCRAAFPLGESEQRIELVVLSYLVPLKPFLGIAAEVVIVVAVILLYETHTQKKKKLTDDGKEFEQIEQLIGKQAAEASVKYCKKQGVRSSVPVEKNITLERPSNIELTCQFITSGNVNSVNVTWKKGDKQLENIHTNAIGNILYTQYMFIITDSKQMGSYSCFLEEEKEQRGTFNFKVPEVQGKNKPLITYVGDSVVLICKCQHCSSLNWTWYTNNGSAQMIRKGNHFVPIDVQMNDKYEIKGTNANETKLKIMHLSEDNKGSYWCRAAFPLGESEQRIELVVLSYLVPLKPFLGIAAEVVIVVAVILLYETHTQKKKKLTDDGKEFEQIEQLKSDDSNGIENNVPRHRKNESVSQ
ncbi:EMB [Vulpes lagopus]